MIKSFRRINLRKFTRGEVITGQTSKATANILVEDITNNRLIISAQDKFIDNEVIVGASSGQVQILQIINLIQ